MRKIHVEFTAKNITGNAGLILFEQFAGKLGIKKILIRVPLENYSSGLIRSIVRSYPM